MYAFHLARQSHIERVCCQKSAFRLLNSPQSLKRKSDVAIKVQMDDAYGDREATGKETESLFEDGCLFCLVTDHTAPTAQSSSYRQGIILRSGVSRSPTEAATGADVSDGGERQNYRETCKHTPAHTHDCLILSFSV